MNKKKYSLNLVSPDNEKFDRTDASFSDVHAYAHTKFFDDDLPGILKKLVTALNDERITDLEWFYVLDEENKTIVYS